MTAHATTVAGLAECTRYIYGVESADAVANQTADNAGGAWYAFKTLKNVTPVYASTGAPVAIPDNNANGATSTIDVTDAQTVLEVKVEINITHTYDGDLEVSLIAPNGTTVSLANRQGGSGDNFRSTVFDDAASVAISSGSAPFTGTYRPETLLSAATGIPAAGAWRLKVVDRAGIDVGTIEGVKDITHAEQRAFEESPPAGGPGRNENPLASDGRRRISARVDPVLFYPERVKPVHEDLGVGAHRVVKNRRSQHQPRAGKNLIAYPLEIVLDTALAVLFAAVYLQGRA